jgi:hypothetical protein
MKLEIRIMDDRRKESKLKVTGHNSGVPGLAVNKGHKRKGWNVTHIESGNALFTGIRSMAKAKIVAGWLADMHDWTLTEKELRNDTMRWECSLNVARFAKAEIDLKGWTI